MKKLFKRGVVSIYITFLILAIIIILVASVMAPMGVRFNTEFYAAGEDILLKANDSMSKIQNVTVRDSIVASNDNALAAMQNNINVNQSLFQYSWILIIGLTALTIFLFTRRLVEFQGGAGGIV